MHSTTTTTLVICLVFAVAAGICNDDDDDLSERLKNESTVDGSTSLLYNLSTKQRRHVKKELLHLLGLNHIPKPSTRRQRLNGSRASAPAYMLSLYETVRRHDVDDDVVVSMVDRTGRSDDSIGMSRLVNKQLGSADTVMSFVNQATSDHENGTHGFAIDCRFDLSGQVSSTDVLTAAFLRIYKSPTARDRTQKIRIEIHRPKTNNNESLLVDRVPKQQTLEQRVTLLSSRSGWIDINLTRMTSHWMTSPKRNEGLRIHVFNHRGALVDPSSVGLIGSNGSPDQQVFLVAFFKNNPDDQTTTTTTSTRRKRSADNNNNNNRNNKRTTRQHDSSRPQNDDHQIWYRTNKQERKCQIRTLKVSFKDLKWQDWIIAPEGYAAYYCDGDCVSLLDAHNATNHAIVQTMAYMMNPSSVPKPCCAPTKLSALSVLYFDDNSNVILKKYRNMVVRACGCH